jgi:hypothetical protein
VALLSELLSPHWNASLWALYLGLEEEYSVAVKACRMPWHGILSMYRQEHTAMTPDTKLRRFSPAQLGCIFGGLLWLLGFVYFWLALGMSINNVIDPTVIGVSLVFGAGLSLFGFFVAFAISNINRQ